MRPRLNRASPRVMARFKRAIVAAAFGVATLALPALAHAESYDRMRYEATLKDIAAMQAELVTLADKIKTGLDAEAAKPLATHAGTRLASLRKMLMEASLADRPRGVGARDARPYARCILWRAGDLEDDAQDLATNLAMIARGAAKTDLIPLDRAGIAAKAPRKGCPG